jgi:hypothetical protein
MSVTLVACGPSESDHIPSSSVDRAIHSSKIQSDQKPASISPEHRAVLAVQIEQAVANARPELTVGHYARYYEEQADGRIRGRYYLTCNEGEASCAEAGASWTDFEQLPPPVMDGGCIVVHVEYDAANAKLIFAGCNGYA